MLEANVKLTLSASYSRRLAHEAEPSACILSLNRPERGSLRRKLFV